MDSDIKAFCDKAWFHTCIRHYFPRYEGDYLTSGWLHRFMGISPPAGSLSAALRGSIIVPDGSHGETACHWLFYGQMDPLCTLFAVMDGCEKPECKIKRKIRAPLFQSQVVLAHPPTSLPWSGAPSGM